MTSLSKLHYKNTNPVSLSMREFIFKHARITMDVFILFRHPALRRPQLELACDTDAFAETRSPMHLLEV